MPVTRSTSTTRAYALLVLVVLTACGCDVVATAASVDEVPVVVVEADALRDATAIEPNETARIPGESHGLAYLVGVRSAGELIVTIDQMLNQVLVFDVSGRLVRKFSGSGDGPGELRRPSSFAVAGDSIYVVDMNGLNVFTVDGQFVRRRAINSAAAGSTSNVVMHPQSLDHDGTGLITSFGVHQQSRNSPFADSIAIHRMSLDGDVGPAVAHAVTEPTYRMAAGMYGPPIFMGRSRFVVSADSMLLITLSSGVDVDVLGAGGQRSRIRIGVDRRKPGRAEIDTLLAVVRNSAGFSDPELSRQYADAFKSQPVADYRSVVGPVVAGSHELLLIRREDLSPIDIHSPEPVTWDLIRRDGTVQGRMRLPRKFNPAVVEPGRIIGVEIDESDVPNIVVLSLAGK